MIRVPFTLPDVGLREVKGIAFIEEGFLVLRVEDAFLGLLGSNKELIKIDPNAIVDVTMRLGIFRHRLVIRPKRAQLLDVLPGDHASTAELRISRKHGYELQRLVDEFERLRRDAAMRPSGESD